MNKLIGFLGAVVFAVASAAGAAVYSTEATMTRQKDKGTCVVLVRVSQVVQRDGKAAEELVAQPKIVSAPGVPASLFTGPQPSNPDYATRETVNVDVSWPEAGKKGFAVCEVTVKLAGQVVCKSKTQVAVEEK